MRRLSSGLLSLNVILALAIIAVVAAFVLVLGPAFAAGGGLAFAPFMVGMPLRPVRDAEISVICASASVTKRAVVRLTAANTVDLPSAASQAPFGVAQDAQATANKEVTILQEGIAECIASGAITAGDFVEVANNTGQVRTKIQTALTSILVPVQISVAPTGIPGGNVAANTTQNVALTGITGLLATDILIGVQKPATQTGLFILPADLAQGGVTGAGAATVKYVNDTVAGITPTAGETYVFTVLRAQNTAQTQPTPIVGRALTAAANAGDIVDVLLMIGASY